jgi:two-component system, chemotaxis family, CheB/CheR fusion protein
VFQANLYLIVFEKAEAASSPQQVEAAAPDAGAEEIIRHLENELRSAQDNAQAMFEELESSNEELKSSNEEFQSTNEELESSRREELQSFNEELQTVNAEVGPQSHGTGSRQQRPAESSRQHANRDHFY